MADPCPIFNRVDVIKLEARRSWVFDQLLALLRNSNMTKQDDWVWSILEFLLVHGLFVVSKANKKSEVVTVSPLYRGLGCPGRC